MYDDVGEGAVGTVAGSEAGWGGQAPARVGEQRRRRLVAGLG